MQCEFTAAFSSHVSLRGSGNTVIRQQRFWVRCAIRGDRNGLTRDVSRQLLAHFGDHAFDGDPMNIRS